MEHISVLEKTLMYWAAGDVEMTVSLMNEDVVYRLYIDEAVVAFAGEHRGKEAVRHFLFSVLEMFDQIEYVPLQVRSEGEGCSARCWFHYVHRASGERLRSTLRLIVGFKDGKIETMDEYHDQALIEAFVRLASAKAAENENGALT